MDGNNNCYDVMVSNNKRKTATKEKIAIEAIQELLARGEEVTVKVLMDVTGFSRSMFYNNEKVAEQLDKAREKQNNKSFNYPQRVILNKALEKDYELLKKILKEKNAEIENLKKEIEALRNQVINLT